LGVWKVRIEVDCAKTPVDERVVIMEERHAEDGRVALEVDNSKDAPLMDGFVIQLEGDVSNDGDFVLGFTGQCCFDWCAFLERNVVVLEEGCKAVFLACLLLLFFRFASVPLLPAFASLPHLDSKTYFATPYYSSPT
jgi:hypothetical protein